MADKKDDKSQTAGDKEQVNNEQKENDSTDDKSGNEKTTFSQDDVNALLAVERRKEAAKAAQIKAELATLKTKDLPEAQQNKLKAESLEQELAKYKAKELAGNIADDLKIPKPEQSKYLKYVTATDENGIKDQLKQLKKDFGATSTGAGTNPPRSGKAGKNDRMNDFIRSGGRITT